MKYVYPLRSMRQMRRAVLAANRSPNGFPSARPPDVERSHRLLRHARRALESEFDAAKLGGCTASTRDADLHGIYGGDCASADRRLAWAVPACVVARGQEDGCSPRWHRERHQAPHSRGLDFARTCSPEICREISALGLEFRLRDARFFSCLGAKRIDDLIRPPGSPRPGAALGVRLGHAVRASL